MGFHIAPHKINFKEADKQSLNGNFDLEKYNLVKPNTIEIFLHPLTITES